MYSATDALRAFVARGGNIRMGDRQSQIEALVANMKRIEHKRCNAMKRGDVAQVAKLDAVLNRSHLTLSHLCDWGKLTDVK